MRPFFCIALVGVSAFAACATRADVDAPRRLMRVKVEASWSDRDTGGASWHGTPVDCSRPLVAHATGREPISFDLRIVRRNPSGEDDTLESATLWLREPFCDDVRRIDVTEDTANVWNWNAETEEFELQETIERVEGRLRIALRLKTSSYPGCRNGQVIESVAIYPYVGLVQAAGCADKVILIDENWAGERVVRVECEGTGDTGHRQQAGS